jgi:hypothetical protein
VVLFGWRKASDYGGYVLYVMGGVWRVTVGRGDEDLPAELLFDTAVLANRLREAGVGIDSIELRDGVCIITPSAKSGRVAPEGRLIRDILKRHYPMYRGDNIHWRWDIRQYG